PLLLPRHRARRAPPSFPTRRSSDLGKHLADPIPIASDVNARIPRWLSDAIVKCLAKQPEGRFQTADEALAALRRGPTAGPPALRDRKSTRLNSSHLGISYAVFCLKK